MRRNEHITIVGGGIAGLATAIALKQRGFAPTIAEQADAFTEIGAGLQISPNGMAVLEALGLGAAVEAAGVRAQWIKLFDHAGRAVIALDLSRGRRAYVLVHRAALIGVLAAAARDAGVSLALNTHISPAVMPESGLLIGADGVKTEVRALMGKMAPPFFTKQVAWRALIPADEATSEPEVRLFMGPGRHVVSYPIGNGLRNIVAVEERDVWTDSGWHHSGNPEDLRDRFADFPSEVRGWLDLVDTVHLWGLFRQPVARRWFRRRAVLVGDAAHPTLPFLGQGANMALEDAWVLSDSLARLPLAGALARYQQLRSPRVQRVVAAATANARNYHLSNPVARVFAHTLLRFAGSMGRNAALRQFDWLYEHDVTVER